MSKSALTLYVGQVLAISLALVACGEPATKRMESPPASASLIAVSEPAHSPRPTVDQPKHITLGVEDSWAPYARADGTGMSVDLVKAAYAAVGIEVSLQVMPYARLLQKVESGELLGCFNVSKVPLRETSYTWGKRPLFVADTFMYHLASSPIDATSLADLRADHRIGLILGYEYGEFIDSNRAIGFERVKTQEQNLAKLLRGRIHGTIMFEKVANEILKTKDLQGKVIQAFVTTPTNIHVAFSQMHADAETRARQLDQGLISIQASGLYAKILARY